MKYVNPSHSKSTTTRRNHFFLHLIDTDFPKMHAFNKIFNRNKVEVSYSWMQIIKAMINNLNINILHQNNKIKNESNCRNKKYCLLGGKYLSPNRLSGKNNLTQPNYNGKVYFGVLKKPLLRFYNRTKSFTMKIM